MFRGAVEVMKRQPHGEAEQAITLLNLADLAEATRELVEDSELESDSRIMRFEHFVLRGEWNGMKRLEEEGYIVLQEADQRS